MKLVEDARQGLVPAGLTPLSPHAGASGKSEKNLTGLNVA
jgi:hypothetical protein